MKKNNKGFTLIELLAVIVILVAIMLVAIPTVMSSMERSQAKQYDAVKRVIESAAELYVGDHKNSFATVGTHQVTIEQLKGEGLLTDKELKDPRNTNKTLGGVVKVIISNNGSGGYSYTYEYIES